MPIKVKDPATVLANWTAGGTSPNAQAKYKAGVQSPKQPQNASAIAAAPRWQQSVSSTQAMNAFKAGLQKAGDQGWVNGALNKGANHYPDGIRGAGTKFQTNVTPFLQAIAGVTLPDKGIRGSSANYARVQAVGDALHALKVARAGGG
jgi:hypothetical protein